MFMQITLERYLKNGLHQDENVHKLSKLVYLKQPTKMVKILIINYLELVNAHEIFY